MDTILEFINPELKRKKLAIVLVCFVSYMSLNAQDSLIYLKNVKYPKLEIYDQYR